MRTLLALSFWMLACCSYGANVVTKTIQQSGGDYTSIAAWEAGRQTNCVAADSIEMGVIQGTWSADDTSAVTINGWTTDSTRYLVVTNSTSKHDGKRYGSAANAYRLATTGITLTIEEDFVRVYGLQIKASGSSGNKICLYGGASWAASASVIIGNCILYGEPTGAAASFGYLSGGSTGTITFFNCLAHGHTNASSRAWAINGGTNLLYNCTAYKSEYDYLIISGVASAWNCISQDSAADGFYGSWGGNYNCSNRAADALGANSVNSYNVAFVSETAGSEDFHITSDNTSIIDVTSDQSGGLFSDDIDGVTRTGSWCIGADEYVAAANSIFQVIAGN